MIFCKKRNSLNIDIAQYRAKFQRARNVRTPSPKTMFLQKLWICQLQEFTIKFPDNLNFLIL